MSRERARSPLNFTSTSQDDIPHGRNGKHKEIVTKIMSDLGRIEDGAALTIPLADLKEGKENVRSALNRATRKSGKHVATASDENYLYVWNEKT